VGLTGNIASGKSTVASYFAALGIDIISADQVAKRLTQKPQPAFQAIATHFGDAAITTTGELDRRYLRHVIFHHPEERLWLENYLHPLIRQQIEIQANAVTSSYCIIEIPLLTDRSLYPYLKRVLLVEAEKEQQISRLATRDNSSKKDALAILATQANQQRLHELADDILTNTGSLAALQKKVALLHEHYLACAVME
jgi:dephospho-CoA kinase